MKKSISWQIAGAVCATLLLSCALGLAQDVKFNYMPGTDFSKYHTYQWTPSPGNIHPSQIVDQQIKMAVDGQLAQKGLTKITEGNPDMYVDYQVAVDQQKQWNAMGMGRFGGMGSATSSTINNGTLVVDLYDVAAKTLIWRGDAAKTLNPGGNQQKNIDNLNKAVAKLLKNYPPPVKK